MGQHSVLASDMMRARIRGAADLAQAADAALVTNTRSMAGELRPFVGEAGVKQFTHLWEEHILALFDYARGLAGQDKALTEHAREESEEYEHELVDYFRDSSKGRLNLSAATGSVHQHAHQLFTNADAYAAGRYADAASGYRSAYRQAYGYGYSVARAVMTGAATRGLGTATVRLQSQLTRLFSEHSVLLMAMTRATTGEPADFSALGNAVNANTLELTAAFDALCGREAAKRFQGLWADQVDQLAEYASAVESGDASAKERARAALATFQDSMGSLLSEATDKRVSPAAFGTVLRDHDARLLSQMDDYGVGSFDAAFKTSQEIHDAVLVFAGQLATGVGEVAAARMPRGGSHTGGGGTAQNPSRS